MQKPFKLLKVLFISLQLKKMVNNYYQIGFIIQQGILKIQIQPKNSSNITISEQLDPILNAYHNQGPDNVLTSGPVFLEGGLFHFIVKIIAIDNSKTILPGDKQPVFNGWLSVGVLKNKVFNVDSKFIPVTILSYYDKINNIEYKALSNSILFNMPFNYDMKRLSSKDTNMYIHQEVYVPKPSILSSAGNYIGLVNGEDVTNNIVIDGSNKTKDIVHFMLTKPIVLQIASKYNKMSTKSLSQNYLSIDDHTTR